MLRSSRVFISGINIESKSYVGVKKEIEGINGFLETLFVLEKFCIVLNLIRTVSVGLRIVLNRTC